MKFFGIIPARSGSKGIKDKNIKIFDKKPLLYWTIQAAQKSKMLKEFIVTTDSKLIARIAKKYGAKVPLLRPRHLSQSNTEMKKVIKYHYNLYKSYDALVLLQPTSPLRNHIDIDKACKMFESSKANSLISITKVKHTSNPDQLFKLSKSPYIEYINKKKIKTLRQKKKNYYCSNGAAIYITLVKDIKKYIVGGKIAAYIMPLLRSIDIDDIFDFKLAELIKKNILK